MFDSIRMLLCCFFIEKILLRLAPQNDEGRLLVKHIKAWVLADLSLISSKVFMNEKLRRKYGTRLKRG